MYKFVSWNPNAMQKRLANKLRMYHVLQRMLTNYKSKWEAVQAIENTFKAFEAYINEIEACNVVSSANTKGETIYKKEIRLQVIERTIEVSSILSALILQTNEQYVGAKLNYSKTKLVKMRDMRLETTCSVIAEQATEHLTLLATAGVTPNDIETLKADIKTFSDLLPLQRHSVTERKVANIKLNDLFAQTDALLKNQLDRLMLRYKQTQPEFYSNYKTSRHVINYGVRHKKEKSEGETTAEKNAE